MVAAIFNAPLPMEHPVDQALQAAQDGLKRLRKLWQDKPDLMRMPMGVGIHAGATVVGLLGSSQHPEYDAIGDTVNIAARLSTYAPAGEIYVTEAVVASAGKKWSFDPLGVVQVRGRYEPVLAYRLRTEE
jgi:class 3 adenylate cyclase